MERFEFTVGEEVVPYYLGSQCYPQMCEVLLSLSAASGTPFDLVVVGCDETVARLHVPEFTAALEAAGIAYHVCVTKPGEPNKSLASLDYVLGDLLAHGCSRNSVLIPFGGGIVGNLFGLAAALLFRGIRLVHAPTTFLSAHDSVTSKKQAVNHAGLKNIVGTYYTPLAILCNVSVFQTLTMDNLRSGCGELTKNAVLFGGEHLATLRPILTRARADRELCFSEEETLRLMRLGIAAKASLLRNDPKERTTAIVFEYGHTVGHALELTYGTSHGCAVALGMLAASHIANKMGIMTDAAREEHDELVSLLGVTLTEPPSRERLQRVFERVAGDNKRGYLGSKANHRPFILARAIGDLHHPNPYYLEHVPDALVEEAIAHVAHTCYRPCKPRPRPGLFHRLGLSSLSGLVAHYSQRFLPDSGTGIFW